MSVTSPSDSLNFEATSAAAFDVHSEPTGLGRLWVVVIGLCLVILACAAMAVWNAALLGWPAIVFLGGVAITAVVVIIGILNVKTTQTNGGKRQTPLDNLSRQAFFDSPDPALILQGGRPVWANKAYYDFAQFLGADANGAAPPGIDRILSQSNGEVATAIFRLHHMQADTHQAEEVIDYLAPDQRLKRYRLVVKRLGGAYKDAFLWQILDVTRAQPSGENLMVHAPIGLFSMDKGGAILAMNPVLSKWLGGEEGTPPENIRHFIETPESLLESTMVAGRTVRTDTRLITRKNVVTPTVMVGSWDTLEGGGLVCNVALYGHSALMESSPSETSLASNQGVTKRPTKTDDRTVAGFASAPVGMLELRIDDLNTPLSKAELVDANPAFERMSEGFIREGKTFADVFAVRDGEHRFLEITPSQCDADRPFDAILVGSSGLPVSVYIVPDSRVPDTLSDPVVTKTVWVFFVDVSARKSLEDQLVQSQKMQAIGQLAAGVAHDFNNLLTAIRLNTDELLQRHPVGDPSYPELQNINSTGLRAGALVKKLLAFSRKQTRRMELLSLTDTLSDMVVTLRQTLGEKAKLVMVHGRNLPPVIADKSQIDTILMNLCVNARDAMADQGGGTITVRSAELMRRDIQDTALLGALRSLPGDQFVTIEVSDTGTGISDEVKAKIFEPFFTTKEQGKGTGLGLATVYGIVQQTGGHLDLRSELGKGTTFRIIFPAADPEMVRAEAESVKAAPPPEPRKPADLAGQGTILFVEDEASVRIIAAKTLRKRGYTVIEAEDGDEALEILEDGEHRFDMMISDVVMPGMDGPTLLKQGRSLLGEARIVFISGYAEEHFSDLLSEEPDVTFLPKPFTLVQLAEKVKSEIGEAQ